MKLYTDRKRIRAAIRAAQIKATTSVAAFRASVEVPYIRIKAVTGRFIKRLQFSDNLALASIAKALFGKNITDNVGASDLPDIVPNKRLINTVGAGEQLDPFQIAKGLSENPKIEDGDYFAEDYTVYGYTIASYEIEFRKPVAEAVGVADTQDIVPNKGLSDGVGAFDGILSKQFVAATSTVMTADITDVASSYLIRTLNNTARARELLAGDLSKPLSDTWSAADAPDVTFARPVADTGETADAETRQFTKAPTDTGATADSENLDFTKGLSDTSTTADSEVRRSTKALVDTPRAVDTPAFGVSRSASDTANVADAPVVLTGRPLADSVGAFDGILSKQFVAATSTIMTADITDVSSTYLIRALNNTARARETLVGNAAKVLADGALAADSEALSSGKVLSDIATATAGDPVFSVTSTHTDSSNAVESIVLKPILGIIDTPVVSDSGSLRMQDYCSFDYFAQDYVGTSLTF